LGLGSPLTSGQRYTVVVAASGGPAITDFGGLAVSETTSDFRASTVEEVESSVAASFEWSTLSNASAYGGSYVVEHLEQARAIFRFTGTTVTWYTNTGPSYGYAYVYVDGHNLGSFNQYATGNHYRVARTFHISSGAHALTVIVRGLKGSSNGTGTNVAIDAFAVGGTRNNTPPLQYTWHEPATTLAFGGAYAQADLRGEAVSFVFRGTGIDWYTITGVARGRAQVFIDGVLKATIDNYSSHTHYHIARSFRGLVDGIHTIRIRVLATHNASSKGNLVDVDRFVVI